MTRWSVQSTEEELKPVGLHSSHCWAYEVNHCGWRKLPQELHVLNVRGGVHGYEEKAVFFEKFSSITHISDVTTRWNKTPPKKRAKLLCFRTKFLSVLEQHYLLQKMTWFTQKHKMIGLKLPPLDSLHLIPFLLCTALIYRQTGLSKWPDSVAEQNTVIAFWHPDNSIEVKWIA